MNAIEIEAIQFKVNRPNRISFNAIPLVVFCCLVNQFVLMKLAGFHDQCKITALMLKQA